MVHSEIHFLTLKQQDLLLSLVSSNPRYKLITLFLLDCGLRISECLSITLSSFNFKSKYVRVQSLKRKSKTPVFRDIPLTERLYFSLIDYLSDNNLNDNDLLFSLSRKTVWSFYNRIRKKNPQLKYLHPHALRHSFATRLISNDVNIHVIRELLGHTSLTSTDIYTHIPDNLLRQSISKIEKKKSWLLLLYHAFFRPKQLDYKPRKSKINTMFFGRKKEVYDITELINKDVNVIIIGPKGIGKSALIDHISTDKKVLKIDDCTNFKSTLIQFIIHILQTDKKALKKALYADIDHKKMVNHMSKLSIPNLSKELIKITRRHEYLIIIDDVTSITNSVVKSLELMNEHFTFLVAARELLLNKASFTSNFERYKLDQLDRQFIQELIDNLSSDILQDIEDYRIYSSHIIDQSGGNPLYAIELINRYSKEKHITTHTVRSIRHTSAHKEINLLPFFIVALMCLMVMRYLGREIGESSYQLIGGVALVFALLGRQFLQKTKRKLL